MTISWSSTNGRIDHKMKPSFSILFLTWTFQNNYGFDLEWPAKYHMKGEYLNFDTDIVKPFEVWLDQWSVGKYACRLDLYNGMLTNYYVYNTSTVNKNNEQESVFKYLLKYPMLNTNGDPRVGCESGLTNDTNGIVERKKDHLDICLLPPLECFTYTGEKIHESKSVQIWIKNVDYVLEDQPSYRFMQEMLIYYSPKDNLIIPIRFTTKKFNMRTGGLQHYSIVTYDVFDENVTDKDLIHNFKNCEEEAAKIINHYQNNNSNILRDTDSDSPPHGWIKNNVKNEFEIRKEIIRDNWKFINEHNSKNLSYKLSLNKFADRSPNELQFLFGTLDTATDDLEQEGTHIFPHTANEIEEIAKGLPENFDLRLQGFISRVKNQGQCASCWAFAAADTMEGALARSNGGLLLDLSVQSLMDCVWPYTTTGGCNPTSSVFNVFKYLLNDGIPTTVDYGLYLEEAGVCKRKYVKGLYTIKYFAKVPLSPNVMRAAIYLYGPLMVTVEINATTLLYYNSGIYFEDKSESTASRHAMTLVGYGVDNGVPYWIAKNSWGQDWGLGGYLLISASDKYSPVIVNAYHVIV